MKNHVRNALLGLVVGDALGVPVEFMSREQLKQKPVTDMTGYGTHHQPPGTWSDDSSLALCLTEELSKGYDLERIGQSFVDWLYHQQWTPHGTVFDVGNTTREAIARLKAGVAPALASDWQETSNGNGALMRILPLLFYIKDFTAAKRYQLTRQVACLTHGHVRSSLACYYYLELAGAIGEGADKFTAYHRANAALTDMMTALKINPDEVSLFDRLLTGSLSTLQEQKIQSTGYVLHTMEASVWCLLTTESYQAAVLKAVNLGEDTDTTGAVTGGLAGLLYGAETIPEHWLASIARLVEIEAMSSRLSVKYEQANS